MTVSDPDAQWLFTPQQFQRTPSRGPGITYGDEIVKRAECVEYLNSLMRRAWAEEADNQGLIMFESNGERGRPTLVLASLFIHRFYMRRSLNDFPTPIIAATILFVASKVEEEPIKLRHIVNAYLDKFDNAGHLKWIVRPYSEHTPKPSELYSRREHEILATEEFVQEALCFDMIYSSPHTLAERALKRSRAHWLETTDFIQDIDNLAGALWTWMQESTYYPLSVLYPSKVIAAALLSICLAQFNETSFRQGLGMASELLSGKGVASGLDLVPDEKEGASGTDADKVISCFETFRGYGESIPSRAIQLELLQAIPIGEVVTSDVANPAGLYKRYLDMDKTVPTPSILAAGRAAGDKKR